MLNIRLQRIGKRGQAYFRIIVAEHTKKPKGGVLEILGSYDPHKKKLSVEKERIEYWMSKGSQISPTVNNLLVNQKIWNRIKMESWKPKRRPKSAEENKPVNDGTPVSSPPIQTEVPVASIEEPVSEEKVSEIPTEVATADDSSGEPKGIPAV